MFQINPNEAIAKKCHGVEITLKQNHPEGCSLLDFLQRLLPIKLENIEEHILTPSVFLDGKARIRSVFYICKLGLENNFSLWVSHQYANDVCDYLESMRFAEDDPELSCQDIDWLEIRYKTPTSKQEKPFFYHSLPEWSIQKTPIYGLAVKSNHKTDLFSIEGQEASTMDQWIDDDLFHLLECCVKRPGIDSAIYRDLMVLDGPFDHFLSRGSGCYPGQEVVEKVYSIGRRPKTLLCCQIHTTHFETPENLLYKGKKVGKILYKAPIQEKHIDGNIATLYNLGEFLAKTKEGCIGLAVMRSLPEIPVELTTEKDGHRVLILSLNT